MTATRFNRKVRLAALILAGSAGSATAQDPPALFPVPTTREPIEIYYGANRVTREPAVVPASTVEQSPKAVDSFRDAMAKVRDGTREITSATVGVLGKVGERIKHTADTRLIIITTTAPAQTAPATQPQVVVVRDAAEAAAIPAAPASIRLETLFACGLGIAAVSLVAWIGLRKTHKAVPSAFAYSPMPLDPNSVHVMGRYNAGPKREAAETFDLGPSFHEEMQKKEQQIEASNAAAVEFILNQNLAFLAELNPDAEGTIVQTDGEGFAVPVLA